MNYDKVTLVDENDVVLGEMDKIEAHRGLGKLHRASSVYLFRKNKTSDKVELLIQQRSELKIVGGLEWGNTICGNVWPTENYFDCAVRRLEDELGIEISEKINIQDVYNFIYHAQCSSEFSERELDHVFFGWLGDGVKVVPNSLEVKNFLWVDWGELQKQVEEIAFDRNNPKSKNIKVFSENKVYNVVFSPWTMLMLKDEKLLLIINKMLNKLK